MTVDWKSVANTVGKLAPLLGTLLGGPAGGSVGALIASALGTDATPDAVVNALAVSPDAAVKLQQIEADKQVNLRALVEKQAEAELSAATAQTVAINQTMQAEAVAEHWPSYSWRPFNGFLFGTTIFCTYFLLPLMRIAAPVIPTEVWIAWGGILGVASWFRGKAQSDPAIPTDSRG